jgi:glycosyltransferase involved in cell wall biosynthesis
VVGITPLAEADLSKIMSSILHLIETGGPGGAEKVFLDVATRLRVGELRNEVAVGREGWLAEEARRRGLQPAILPAQGSLNADYLKQLVRLIRRQDARVVIAHLFGAAVYGSLAGLLTGVPVISVLHGQSDIAERERFAALKRWIVARGSRHVVFVSQALRDFLQARLVLPADKATVIENGIDTAFMTPADGESVRTALDFPGGTFLVGSVGNVRPAKGYETLLRGAQIVRAQRPQVRFAIAGDTSGSLYPQLERLRDSLGLSDTVRFLGLRRDVSQVLAALDLFVLSSDTEGFSLALVEAMASGRCVVATRSGGPEALVEHGRTGLLVPPRDPAALAQTIISLVDDAPRRAQLAAAARQAVTERFDNARMIGDYARLVSSVL